MTVSFFPGHFSKAAFDCLNIPTLIQKSSYLHFEEEHKL